MANVEDLRRLLEPHTEADVTSTFQKFRESMHSEDLGQFVDYMVAQGLLAPEAAPVVAAELRAGSEEATIAEPRGATTLWGSAEPQSAAPRSPAASLRLSDVLGQGGMGIVFRGEQVDLGRSRRVQAAARRVDEIAAGAVRPRGAHHGAARSSEHRPGVTSSSSPGRRGSIGYAMKLVEGKTLRACSPRPPSSTRAGKPIDAEHSLPTRLEHFLKICDAVAFAHDRASSTAISSRRTS
jgi:hypothetical protein